MRTQVQVDCPPEVWEALRRLSRAHACAQDLKFDPWEFALRKDELGVDATSVRWLVFHGFVDLSDELTTVRDTARRFRPRANSAFTDKTCFVLSKKGLSAAGSCSERPHMVSSPLHIPDSPRIVPICAGRPQWDRTYRVLMFDGSIVKRYRLRADNQEAVLGAFEEEGWPLRIDDPLSPEEGIVPKERLKFTIKRLNAHQENHRLRFFGDGTGKGICWEAIATATSVLLRAA